MPRIFDAESTIHVNKVLSGLPASDTLNVTVVYDDASSRRWAGDILQQTETSLGNRSLRATWWNLADLGQSGVLAGAVSKAMRSDAIVVAVQSSEGLPLPFYFWVNSWVPHRVNGPGALIALLASPLPRTPEAGRLRKYFRNVAKCARMELLVNERVLELSSRKSALFAAHLAV